ncbi:hypothetical protein [uncultured Piscinibacter sp.]|uniref:hypothetical protein n=1 Tax=uncultured Piscinibacter sp. TaxID=1131835 RepID=UPI00260B14AC|nr:hypothetical protein [uncultured Piscinibacter sp.]
MTAPHRLVAALALAAGTLLLGGCTTSLVIAHLYDKITEGDPTSCFRLNSVERALQPRCGPYVAGSISARDVAAPGLPVCPLTLAARDPALWPVLPELIDKGATPEACTAAPWVALAQAHPCPDFARASPEQVRSLRWLAEADARAIHHDVVRALSCPSARRAGLDLVLDQWLAQDQLRADTLPFGMLGALHPSHLNSTLARTLEARGHTAVAGLGAYNGQLAPGFEEALRVADFDALDWWIQRVPSLVDRAPPSRGNQLPWAPLARAITPAFLPDLVRQREVVSYLLAHGAEPWRPLPHDPQQTPASLAMRMHSPLAETLAGPRVATTRGAAPVAAAAAIFPRR